MYACMYVGNEVSSKIYSLQLFPTPVVIKALCSCASCVCVCVCLSGAVFHIFQFQVESRKTPTFFVSSCLSERLLKWGDVRERRRDRYIARQQREGKKKKYCTVVSRRMVRFVVVGVS